jgi:hypothetical protein
MKMKFFQERLAACKVDDEILDRSRLARFGNRMIQLAVIIRVVEPALLLVATLILMSAPALAQTPIFSGTDQTVGGGLKEFIRYARNALFLLGVGGVGWGAVNYMMEKAWIKQILGGGMCMGFGAIASLVYSFSQGRAVDLDTDLGN